MRVAIGVAVAKTWAVLIGPAGLGALGLLQSAVGVVGIVAGLGVGVGIVRLGAQAIAEERWTEARALDRAAVLLSGAAGLVAVGVTAALRNELGIWLFDGEPVPHGIGWLGCAVWFTALGTAKLGALNAHHRVGALARATVVGAASGSVMAVGLVWVLGVDAVVWAVLALTGGVGGAAWLIAAREIQYPHATAPQWRDVWAAGRKLLSFGVPYVGSSLVGSGVLLSLPLIVGQMLTVEDVGYYRAATAISVGYLGFLTTALAQDFYPRVSAASADSVRVTAAVNEQLRVVLLIGGVVVVAALATAPLLIPIVYSSAFRPAIPLLSWHLIGSIFKFWAWTFSFVILARGSAASYFIIESIIGAALVGATTIGIERLGLVGAGVGYAAAYVLYAGVTWGVAQREGRIRVTPSNFLLFGTSLGGALLVYSIQSLMSSGWSMGLSLAIALTAAAAGAGVLWKDYRTAEPVSVS